MKTNVWRRSLGAAIIVAATWFVYSPAWHGGWLWDDDVEITGNLALRSGAGLWRIWFAPPAADYFPLKTTVQWVQWHFWGANVAGYHATNIGLHLLSAFLLWTVLQKIFARGSTVHPERSRRVGGRKPFDSAQGEPCDFAAWLGGLIFAIHPLAVESVAWISELKNVLSLPLLLLAMIFWIRWSELSPTRSFGSEEEKTRTTFPMERIRDPSSLRCAATSNPLHLQSPSANEARSGQHAPPFYILSLLCFVAAMLSKSSVVMFPFILLLYAWWRRGRVGRRDLLATVPFFAVSLVLGVVTIWFQSHRALAGETILTGGLSSRIAAAGLAAAFYFWKSVWPFGLMPIYRRWAVDPPALWQFWPWVVIGMVVLSSRWSELSPTRWFDSEEEKTRTTLPMKRIGDPSSLRYAATSNPLHLPSANEARSGSVFAGLRRDKQHAPPAVVRHIVFGLGFFFINLLPVLGFVPMSFFRLAWVADHLAYLPLVGLVGLSAAGIGAVFEVAPAHLRSVFVFMVLALVVALAVQGRRHAALFADSRTLWTYNLRHNPEAWAARNNLGNALLDAGLVQEATDNYEEALRLHPVYAEVYNNLGNVFSQTGQVAEAAADYQRALQIKPDYAEARNGLGNMLSETGRVPEAIGQFELALRESPDFASAHNNLANVLFRLGRYREAEDHLRKALLIQPDYPEAHNNLGNVLLRTGRVAAAMAEYREALRLKPDFPQAYNNVGNVQMMSGRFPEAIAAFDESIRLRPGYAEAHYNLGLMLAGTGRVREAIAQFELALQFRPDFPQARAQLDRLQRTR